jgi:hypothetical protein
MPALFKDAAGGILFRLFRGSTDSTGRNSMLSASLANQARQIENRLEQSEDLAKG